MNNETKETLFYYVLESDKVWHWEQEPEQKNIPERQRGYSDGEYNTCFEILDVLELREEYDNWKVGKEL